MENSIDFIKRVVGLPSETLEIINHKVFINREPLIERYIGTAGRKNLLTRRNSGPFEIPADGVFVLGDNRGASYDSRHYRFVNLSAIHGKALYLIWADDANRIGKKLE